MRQIDGRSDAGHRPEVVHVPGHADDGAARVGAALPHPRAQRELVTERGLASGQRQCCGGLVDDDRGARPAIGLPSQARPRTIGIPIARK